MSSVMDLNKRNFLKCAGLAGITGAIALANAKSVLADTVISQNKVQTNSLVCDSIVDVKGYGAVGNGSTDDTAAIQAAINASAGKMLIIPPSSSNYMVSQLTVPSNTHIILNGALKQIAHSNIPIMYSFTTNNVVIEGAGTIDGDYANQSYGNSGGVVIYNSSHVTVRDITIQNIQNWCINVVQSHECLLDGITAYNGGNANEFAGQSYNCWARNCDFNVVRNDMTMAFYGGVYNSGIIGCRAHGSTLGNAGIIVYADAGQPNICHDILISNNHSYGNTGDGISVASTASQVHQNINIIGNVTYGNSQNNAGQPGIRVRDAKYVNVIGNIIHDEGNGNIGMPGLLLDTNISHILASGNQITNIGQGGTGSMGIYIQGCGDLTIKDNTICDDQVSKTMLYGIAGSAGNNVIIQDNNISGQSGVAINMPSHGTGNVWCGNVGYNPVGYQSTGNPISGTLYSNTNPFNAKVAISGGTVSSIEVGGHATGLTNGLFHLAVGETFKVTFSVAPTWVWWGI